MFLSCNIDLQTEASRKAIRNLGISSETSRKCLDLRGEGLLTLAREAAHRGLNGGAPKERAPKQGIAARGPRESQGSRRARRGAWPEDPLCTDACLDSSGLCCSPRSIPRPGQTRRVTCTAWPSAGAKDAKIQCARHTERVHLDPKVFANPDILRPFFTLPDMRVSGHR